MTKTPLQPPVAPRRHSTRVHHGDEVVDEYEWMRDKTDEHLLAHLAAENTYTDAMTAHLADVRDDIFGEIKSHVQQSDLSVPVRHGDWWYYTRTMEGAQYPVYARVAVTSSPQRPEVESGSVPDGEQVMLDANAEAADEEFFSLGALDVSVSGALLAYAVDTTGDERFDLRVKDLATGDVLDSQVDAIGYGVAWSADDEYLFYTRVDQAWRPYQIWRHRLGEPVGSDVLVHQEDDERYWMGLGTSRDDRYVMIGLGSKNTSEWWLLPAAQPLEDFTVVATRSEGVEYDVEPAGDGLWIVHNRNHTDFELAWAPADTATPDEWLTVLPGAEGVRISSVDAFATHLAISVRKAGLTEVEILPLDSSGQPRRDDMQTVPVDEAIYTVEVGSNPDYQSSTVQVQVESMLTPASVFDLDVQSGTMTLLKRKQVPGGYDPSNYVQQRLWATASDGTSIAISLVYHRHVEADGTAAGVLYGYGAYEICVDPHFSPSRLSYLDRGVVYAIAHVRGGGELGRSWYEGGRMEHKLNTFTDFVASADYLTESGWVAPGRLAAVGGSAGGLLIGAVINLAPSRF
ncbi:MAG: prolyl oligopeptidase family serine peptidase, partial [Ornithinimicrobium sp.]